MKQIYIHAAGVSPAWFEKVFEGKPFSSATIGGATRDKLDEYYCSLYAWQVELLVRLIVAALKLR